MMCEICRTKMLHYENPDRWVCPNENAHAKIEAQRRPKNEPVRGRTIIGETDEERKKRRGNRK